MGCYPLELKGQRFYMLTAIQRVGTDKEHNALWECTCDCGNVTIVPAAKLKNGHTKSCGCYHKNYIGNLSRKHSETHTRLYTIWANLKRRCLNPNDTRYKSYAGRGIGICNEWRNSYESFARWAKNNGYTDNLSLDRINNNGNYEPSNCRWTTNIVQCNNKRNNLNITWCGKTQTVTQWERELDFKKGTLYSRIFVYHWDVQKAFTHPLKKRTVA